MFGFKAFDIGLIAFAFANAIFLVLPWLDRDLKFYQLRRPAFFAWFWILMVDLIVLTVYTKLPPTGANAWVGFFLQQYHSFYYLLYPSNRY